MPTALPGAEPHAADFRRALRELTRLQQLRDRARVRAAGITVAGGHALEVLAERGPVSLTALSAALYVDRSTACRIVGLLEDHGYVARRPDARDGRAIRVELTAGGRALEAGLRGEAVREAAEDLAGFGPEARGEALRFLRRLTRASALHAGAASSIQEEDDPDA
jgi:DNA-binding MarR family transcriptional regulator